MINSLNDLTNIDEEITKKYPELLYEGDIQRYEDELDYVNFTLKGAIIA